jgi:hypothetical protein
VAEGAMLPNISLDISPSTTGVSKVKCGRTVIEELNLRRTRGDDGTEEDNAKFFNRCAVGFFSTIGQVSWL